MSVTHTRDLVQVNKLEVGEDTLAVKLRLLLHLGSKMIGDGLVVWYCLRTETDQRWLCQSNHDP